MKYNFTVVNVDTITKSEFINKIKCPFVIISIVSPEFEDYKIPYNPFCKDILYLRFHDLDSKGHVIGALNPVKKHVPLNEEHIDKILEFVNNNKEIEEWLIHCEAGLSRSPGTAMALSEIMNETKSPQIYIQSMNGLKFHNVDIKLKILKRYQEKEK